MTEFPACPALDSNRTSNSAVASARKRQTCQDCQNHQLYQIHANYRTCQSCQKGLEGRHRLRNPLLFSSEVRPSRFSDIKVERWNGLCVFCDWHHYLKMDYHPVQT